MNASLTRNESRLVALLRGPKLSDRQLAARLGLSPAQSMRLMHSLRTKLNVDACTESLRGAVQRIVP